jgi:hypothetical protein
VIAPKLRNTALILLALSLLPIGRAAESISEILGKIQLLRSKADFKTNGRLVRVDSAGQRVTYHLGLKGKCFGTTMKVLCEVAEPASSRQRLLISSSLKGPYGIRLLKALNGKSEELSSDHRGDAFLGSHLSYEDLADAHFSWQKQTLVGVEKCGSRLCYVIRSEPSPGESFLYSSVTSWIDRELFVPVCIEKITRGSGATKEFLYSGIRESHGFWAARQIEIRIKGESPETLLIMTQGTGKANLSETNFDPGSWTKIPDIKTPGGN